MPAVPPAGTPVMHKLYGPMANRPIVGNLEGRHLVAKSAPLFARLVSALPCMLACEFVVSFPLICQLSRVKCRFHCAPSHEHAGICAHASVMCIYATSCPSLNDGRFYVVRDKTRDIMIFIRREEVVGRFTSRITSLLDDISFTPLLLHVMATPRPLFGLPTLTP
ncbi:unnamed protein product [Protopolystoma xenopodis]|uniref:Uncharacterized protein n=1 Tax=Protopolystoma xenopodis TaxID=117903 RepID=A0A448X7H0_9PLAT|nr:unnamed protein product [Protopolystoma xenopodis]